MGAGDFVFTPNRSAIADLAFDEDTEDFLEDEVGDPLAEKARAGAPRKTGAGAASIQAVVGEDSESSFVDVSWDAEHDYLRHHEEGTEDMPARPFLRPALESTQI